MFRLLFLGIGGTGREDILARLIRSSLVGDERVSLVLPDALQPGDWLSGRCQVGRWRFNGDGSQLLLEGVDADADCSILVAEGHLSPVPLIESLSRPGPAASAFWPDRVVTLVDAGLASRESVASEWYYGAAHFSDLVLIKGLGADSDGWVQQFEGRLQADCWPCLVDRVRKGQPRHPDWAFDPVPRRLSLLFEEEVEEVEADGESESEPIGDPFTERNPAGGYRRPFPGIGFLAKADGW